MVWFWRQKLEKIWPLERRGGDPTGRGPCWSGVSSGGTLLFPGWQETELKRKVAALWAEEAEAGVWGFHSSWRLGRKEPQKGGSLRGGAPKSMYKLPSDPSLSRLLHVACAKWGAGSPGKSNSWKAEVMAALCWKMELRVQFLPSYGGVANTQDFPWRPQRAHLRSKDYFPGLKAMP